MQLVVMRAMNETVRPGEFWKQNAFEYRTLNVESLEEAFSTTFEQAAERLQDLPGTYFEPDGSFVRTGWRGDWFWRLEGNLYDRHNALLFVELRIDCPREPFEQVVAALVPDDARIYELPGEGVFLDEATLKAMVFGE